MEKRTEKKIDQRESQTDDANISINIGWIVKPINVIVESLARNQYILLFIILVIISAYFLLVAVTGQIFFINLEEPIGGYEKIAIGLFGLLIFAFAASQLPRFTDLDRNNTNNDVLNEPTETISQLIAQAGNVTEEAIGKKISKKILIEIQKLYKVSSEVNTLDVYRLLRDVEVLTDEDYSTLQDYLLDKDMHT